MSILKINILIFITFLSFDIRAFQEGACDETFRSTRELILDFRKNFTLIESNSGLQELNTRFGNQGLTDFITGFTHWRFIHHLYEAFEGHEIQFQTNQDYIKEVVIDLSIEGSKVERWRDVDFDDAIEMAIKSTVTDLVTYLNTKNMQLLKTHPYVNQLLSKNNFLKNIPQRSISIPPGLVDFIRDNYAKSLFLGAGFSRHHAAFAASLAKQSGSTELHYYDPSRMEFMAHSAKLFRSRLLSTVPDNTATLESLFSHYRNHASLEDTDTWSTEYKNILRQYAGELALEQIRLHFLIGDYLEAIDAFRYIIPGSAVPDMSSRFRYESIKNPTAHFLFDIRGLGSKAYLHTHQALPAILEHIEAVRAAYDQFEGVNERIGFYTQLSQPTDHLDKSIDTIQKNAMNAVIKFNNYAQNILYDTKAFLDITRTRLEEKIQEFGLNPNQYVIWSTGDDIFMVVHDTQIDAKKLLDYIFQDEELRFALRGVGGNLPGHSAVNIENTAAQLGPAFASLKNQERTQNRAGFYATLQTNTSEQHKYYLYNGISPEQIVGITE